MNIFGFLRVLTAVLALTVLGAANDQLKVTRAVRLYEQPTSLSQKIRTLQVGEILTEASPGNTNDYIEVDTDQGEHGWVYRLRVIAIAGNGGTGGSTTASHPIHGTTTRAFSDLAPITASQMRIHFIDVGQGASTLLEFPCGAALIDTGGEKLNPTYNSVPALRGYLDAFFQSRSDLNGTLNLLAITHPHIDHTRGIHEVLDNFGVANIIDNGERKSDLGGTPQIFLEDWASQHAAVTNYLGISEGDIPAGGLTNATIDPLEPCSESAIDPRIQVLWGDMGDKKNANNNSLAIRVDFDQFSFLVDGDLEEAGIAGMLGKIPRPAASANDLINVDVWEVAHHGSYNATTPDLVSRLSPQLAIVCCGPFEREGKGQFIAREFAHPRQEALDGLVPALTTKRTTVKHQIGQKGAYSKKENGVSVYHPAVFKQDSVSAGLFATGWEGNLVLTANADGTFSIWTEKDGTNIGLAFH